MLISADVKFADTQSFKAEAISSGSVLDVDFGTLQNYGSLPIATKQSLGVIAVGNNLEITPDGTLSVETADAVSQDNTKPITSAAVYMEVGNINVLLETI